MIFFGFVNDVLSTCFLSNAVFRFGISSGIFDTINFFIFVFQHVSILGFCLILAASVILPNRVSHRAGIDRVIMAMRKVLGE